MKVIEIDDYLEQHPGLHWVRRNPFALLDRMVEAAPGFGWPPYEGGFLRVSLEDVKKLSFGSWEKELSKGLFFRIVITDDDDSVWHRLYPDEASARADVDLLQTAPIAGSDLMFLGIRAY